MYVFAEVCGGLPYRVVVGEGFLIGIATHRRYCCQSIRRICAQDLPKFGFRFNTVSVLNIELLGNLLEYHQAISLKINCNTFHNPLFYWICRIDRGIIIVRCSFFVPSPVPSRSFCACLGNRKPFCPKFLVLDVFTLIQSPCFYDTCIPCVEFA